MGGGDKEVGREGGREEEIRRRMEGGREKMGGREGGRRR